MIYHVVIMECAAYPYDHFGPFSSKSAAEKEIKIRYPDDGDESGKYASIIPIDLSKLKDEELEGIRKASGNPTLTWAQIAKHNCEDRCMHPDCTTDAPKGEQYCDEHRHLDWNA